MLVRDGGAVLAVVCDARPDVASPCAAGASAATIHELQEALVLAALEC